MKKEKLLAETAAIQAILDDKNLLFKEIEDGLRSVANKFGDKRRTRLINLDYKNDEEDAEPIEKERTSYPFYKSWQYLYTRINNSYDFPSRR